MGERKKNGLSLDIAVSILCPFTHTQFTIIFVPLWAANVLSFMAITGIMSEMAKGNEHTVLEYLAKLLE